MNRFSGCHPIVSTVYFVSVLLLTMFTTHPVLLGFALLGGIAFCATMEHGRSFGKGMALYGGLFVLIALTNPLFSHNGATPLFFLNGNPVTLEAILYGVDIAAMLIAVIYWCKCFHHVMTSDKLLFLLGKFSPKIALVVSAALRFVPLLKGQAQTIRQAQKAMGLFTSDHWLDTLRATVRMYSALITWSLENAVDTGSSMKGRGYGLKGRSHFALFRFTPADGVLVGLILVLDGIVCASLAAGALDVVFYPHLSVLWQGMSALPAFVAFGLLAFLPVILEVREGLRWNYYTSKI